MSHTPRPWRVVKDAVVTDNQVGNIPADAETLKYYGGDVICESATPSNARLIAAAPDLLAALKKWLAADERENLQQIIAESRAAIAKAEAV